MLKFGIGKVGVSFISKNSPLFDPLPMPEDYFIITEGNSSAAVLTESGENISVELNTNVS